MQNSGDIMKLGLGKLSSKGLFSGYEHDIIAIVACILVGALNL